MLRILVVALVVGWSSGCARRLKTENIGNGQLGYYTAEGGVIVAMGPKEDMDGVPSLKNVCLFPPAQAIRLVSGEGEGKVAAKDVKVGGSGKVNQTVQLNYSQTTSTLFLQMTMYRLCEANANGYFGEDPGIYEELFEKILTTSETLAQKEMETATQVAAAAQADAQKAEALRGIEEQKTLQLRQNLSGIAAPAPAGP